MLARLDAHRIDHLTFLRLRLADHKGNLAKPDKTLAEIRAFLKKMETALFSENRQQKFNRSMLAVNGTDLIQSFSLPPGKEVGRLLNALFEHVLDHPERNHREVLLDKAAVLLGRSRREWTDLRHFSGTSTTTEDSTSGGTKDTLKFFLTDR